MKKLLKLASFLAIACISFAGCSDSDDPEPKPEPKPEPTKLSLAISVSAPSIVVEDETTITIKASEVAKTAIIVNIASDNAAVTVPATLTIEAGKDAVTGVARGAAVGSAKITITATDVQYSAQSVNITVSAKEVPVEKTPALSISSVSSFIKPGNTAKFTITSTVAPKADLTITLTSDHPEFATVPASVVMKAGETSIGGDITGVADGVASISIAAEGVDITKKTIEITVNQFDPVEIGVITANGILSPTSKFINLICKYGKTTVYPGALYAHQFDKTGKTNDGINRGTVDVYGGTAVGKLTADGEVFFTPIEEGTVIDDNLDWQSFFRFPIVVKEGDAVNSMADGTHFIVLKLSKGGTTGEPFVPCWMKIKVTGLNIEVLDGAMLLNDAPFKVGQKK